MSQTIDPKFINIFREAFHEGDQNAANKLEEEKNVRQLEDVFRLVAGRDYGKLSEILAEDVIFEIIGSPNNFALQNIN